MDLTRPYAAISPSLDPGVLTVLAGTTRPLTGREIARLTGRASHSGVMAVLDRLCNQGIVDREEAGRAFLFTLNREHVAAPAVELLADLREELLRRIRDAVDGWTVKARHLSLFGSAARGEGGVDSDIDLFVVRSKAIEPQEPVWREQLDLLGWQVERWTGNPGRIVEMEEREIARLRKERPPIVEELLVDAIALAGTDISDLLGKP
ncbi:MAG TPA: nucleotidyltransferase domain-containing protein [Solirubrobacterales bacterium]|nr:nucleotidyltransferase domain-containing protein [Solirubrobacterales bacterium]